MDEDPYTMGAVGNDDIWEWKRNDELGVVEYPDGTTRPYNEEELAARDIRAAAAAARVAAEQAQAESQATREDVLAAIAELNAFSDALAALLDVPNPTVNANPAGYIKDVARAGRKAIGVVKDIARLI